ncbi:unnamed protein product [Closterium sp. Naga37s-1]|nr:unnamed protein product [Closterium sp. Naga37s-1]
MSTLRSAFVLALVLASLPALYAASAPLRGDVAAGGSAAVDAPARWGRKLLESSSGSSAATGADADVDHVGGEEEEVGEVTTDGLEEAVRVLLGSDADVEQQGGEEENEEEVGDEVTDGLDEAVRVLLTWGEMKNAAAAGTSTSTGKGMGGKMGDIASKAVAANAQSGGLGGIVSNAVVANAQSSGGVVKA